MFCFVCFLQWVSSRAVRSCCSSENAERRRPASASPTRTSPTWATASPPRQRAAAVRSPAASPTVSSSASPSARPANRKATPPPPPRTEERTLWRTDQEGKAFVTLWVVFTRGCCWEGSSSMPPRYWRQVWWVQTEVMNFTFCKENHQQLCGKEGVTTMKHWAQFEHKLAFDRDRGWKWSI